MSEPRSTRPNSQDVAKLAGVSRAMVSYVLNGRMDLKIAPATRERVLAAARSLDYRVSHSARALRLGRTNTFGFYTGGALPDVADTFYRKVVGGLQQGCHRHGRDLLLHHACAEADVEAVFASLTDGRVDGLIVLDVFDEALVGRLAASSTPVVSLVNALPGMPAVVADDEGGERLMLDHLVSRGVRTLCVHRAGERGNSVARREAAFIAAAEARGVPWRACPTRTVEPSDLGWLAARDFEPPAVFVTWMDVFAYTFIAACARLGLRVPEDIGVVGFDDLPRPDAPLVRLTTLHAPWEQVGLTAIDALVTLHDGGQVAPLTVLPVSLVAGETA
ncbi:MAG: LacI family DNA-binding transcriptional regulator [Armatimonadetes bacterium]|nr:LacI family DNA-binding transcriptional regulator [Armatimonadota bacterium]